MDGAVAGTVAAFGGIDVVLANAGVGNSGTVAISPADVLVRTIDVNVNGVVRTVSAALPHVTERRGYVMIVSSTAAFTMMPGMAAYAASKAAVEQFANCLRLEVAHKGVKVGSVHPGWIDTDLVRDQRKDLKTFDEAFDRFPWPMNATTSVEECADAIVDGMERRRRARLRAEGDRPRAGAADAHHRRGRQLAHPPRGEDAGAADGGRDHPARPLLRQLERGDAADARPPRSSPSSRSDGHGPDDAPRRRGPPRAPHRRARRGDRREGLRGGHDRRRRRATPACPSAPSTSTSPTRRRASSRSTPRRATSCWTLIAAAAASADGPLGRAARRRGARVLRARRRRAGADPRRAAGDPGGGAAGARRCGARSSAATPSSCGRSRSPPRPRSRASARSPPRSPRPSSAASTS